MGDRASLGPAIPIYDMGTGMGKPIEMTKNIRCFNTGRRERVSQSPLMSPRLWSPRGSASYGFDPANPATLVTPAVRDLVLIFLMTRTNAATERREEQMSQQMIKH